METQELIRFRCPSCGWQRGWDEARALLACDHCGNTEELTQDQESAWRPLLPTLHPGAPRLCLPGTLTGMCSGCGAPLVFAARETSVRCPFCTCETYAKGNAEDPWTPEGAVPFTVTEEQARAALAAGRSRPALPEDVVITKGERVFVPAWVFSCTVQSRWAGTHIFVSYEGKKLLWREVAGGREYKRCTLTVCAAPDSWSLAEGAWTGVAATMPAACSIEVLAGARSLAPSMIPPAAYRRAVDALQAQECGWAERQTSALAEPASRCFPSDWSFQLIMLPVWLFSWRRKEDRGVAFTSGSATIRLSTDEGAKVEGEILDAPSVRGPFQVHPFFWVFAAVILLLCLISYFEY